RYAAWMVDHERAYFDHPEQLEYPTETWAAQELRKANVFRLAAAHADEPLRSRLLCRGEDMAERAWSDLLRFGRAATTRALAIVYVEGAKDGYFRSHGIRTKPRVSAAYDFGQPERFLPQRQRILARAKTVPGLARMMLRLADVRRWARLIFPAR